MQGYGVGRLVVDTFDDVDLAGIGPVGTEHPEGRPDTAASRHMGNIGYEQSLACFLQSAWLKACE